MKLTYITIALALLLIVGASAETDTTPEPRMTGTNDTIKTVMIHEETVNAGDTQQLQNKVQTVEAVQQQLQEQKQAMAEEVEGMSKKAQTAYQNQNEVRVAVHALKALGNMTDKGQQIAAIAKEFNNSFQKTVQAEEQIEKKSGFARFFSGGDEKAAQSLKEEATKNQERIQELKQIQEECDCDEAVKAMLQEQVMNLEQEQTRIQELAEKEQQKKGLLGWLWK